MNEISAEVIGKLIRAALSVRERAYAPYSHFLVGAALLASSGRIYEGCNVENSSYPAGICAERSAVCQAVSAGERKIRAIVITGGKEGEPAESVPPCGICRQVLSEFCDPEQCAVILAASENDYETHSLADLLPLYFTLRPETGEEQ